MEGVVGLFNYLVFFSIQGGIFAMLCLGLNLQWGHTGLFNIGVAGFYALGAYTSALVSGLPPQAGDWRVVGGFELPFLFGVLAAVIVSGFVALLISVPVLRLKEDYLAIATIGIAEVIRMVFQNEQWLSNGVWGIKHIPAPLQGPVEGGLKSLADALPALPAWITRLFASGYNLFYLALVLATLYGLYRLMEHLMAAPWGRVLRAVKEDEVVAASAGKNVFAYKMQAMVLGAMLMGVGGAFYAHFARFIDAPTFDPLFATFLPWVMLIVGGSGNNRGAILGAFLIWGVWAGTDFLTGVVEMQGYRSAAVRIFIVAVVLEAMLLWRPDGLLTPKAAVGAAPRP